MYLKLSSTFLSWTGTSDEHITVVEGLQGCNPDGVILVTTPQVSRCILHCFKKKIIAKCLVADFLNSTPPLHNINRDTNQAWHQISRCGTDKVSCK